MYESLPLLMVPGPVEISPVVRRAAATPPPGHTTPRILEAFGASIERMRQVWRADAASQPFILAGSGTLAMEMAAANLLEPGERALVVNSGYFSDRMAEILRRYGVEALEVGAAVGEAPPPEAVREALERSGPVKALFATHVDTSTGVRVDPEPFCRLARAAGVLAIVDGVCATAGERFDMADWGADVYLTASQKALGLPPGLGLLVASARALEVRAARRTGPPPLFLDWHSWLPVHKAYEERRPSYFATPATSLILALEAGLGEILQQGMDARIAAHARAAALMRLAWQALDLRPVPRSEAETGNTLSVLHLPDGVELPALLSYIATRGITVAGGLHASIRTTSFRVGHMGYTVTRPDWLRRAVEAVADGLRHCGAQVDVEALRGAMRAID